MSMEMNESYNYYKTNGAEWKRAEQPFGRAEKAMETKEGQNVAKSSDKLMVPQDEYVRSEESCVKPSGLYRVEQDEDGNSKVLFDEWRKSGSANGKRQTKVNSDDPENSTKQSTTNTDKVDREIEKLKEKKQQLEQQIRAALGDRKKVKELERKLALIERELSQKDNDTYRRKNASVTE